MANLNWKILTKKRPGVTQGLPPDTDDLAWVTNTVTLIHGEHDAILVDTFLSVQHSKDLVDWLVEVGKESRCRLHHSCAWRPFPWTETPIGPVPQRAGVCHCFHRRRHAGPNQAGFCTVFLGIAFSWSDSL